MRRNKVWLLLVVLGLIFPLAACGGEATPAEEAAPTIEATPTPRPVQATATPVEATPTAEPVEATPAREEAASGDFWADIPVYPGATEIEEAAITAPGAEYYEKVEWRYYETRDVVDEVVSFYQAEMPKEGWEKVMWMDLSEEVSMGSWQKGEEIGAMTWVGEDEEGRTVIVMWRAEGKE